MGKGFIRYLLATVFIVIGVILILGNIGIATFNMKNAWLYIYPALFIVFGLKWMIDKIRYKGGSWVFGSFFFIFGTLLILDRFEVIAFAFKDIFKLWPLLIIYAGFSFIGHGPVIYTNTDQKRKVKKAGRKGFSLVGDQEFSQPNWKVEPINLRSLAGDFYFDFSKAFIPEKEIPITISALAGDVHILIPENVEFCVQASVQAGDIEVVGQTLDGIFNRSLVHKSDHYDEAVQKLKFNLTLKAGSVRIDYV